MIEEQSHHLEADRARPRPSLSWAMAIVTVLTISIGSIGAWIAARNDRPVSAVVSGPGLSSPTPSPSATPAPVLPAAAQLVAPSARDVWVLMDYDALFRSTDQGNTWVKRSLPTPPGGIRPVISFINAQEGWLLEPGVPATQCEEAAADVWHTADGAATWQHMSFSGIAKSQCKNGVWFVDAKHGFITASDPNHQPTIYRTADGGSSWTASTLPDPPDFKSSAGGFVLNAEWIKPFGSTLFLEASNSQTDPATSRQYLFSSADGVSWVWRQKVPPRSPVMVTETRFLLLTGPNAPQESTNGGQQWHPFQTDLVLDSTEFGGTQIVFADAQTGYETGGGLLQRTVDGGAHWVRIQTSGTQPAGGPSPSPTGVPLPTTAQLSAPAANIVWAVVANQYLLRSADEGNSWQQRAFPPYKGGGGQPLMSFVDDTTGWVLFPGVPATGCSSQGAQLWRTTDGAATWQLAAVAVQTSSNGIPFDQCKDAMYFVDAQHGWLATGGAVSTPKIWRTTDGGLDWTAGSMSDSRLTPANGALRVASLKSFGNIVLASIAPYVYGSIDGGVSWAYITETPAASHSIGFVTTSRWIELITPDQSSETTDGGQSWHSFNTDYSQAAPIAPQIVFADASIGYATVRGSIQMTVDGGAHWSYIWTPGTQQP